MQLLRLLKRLETTSIDELESRVYRFILGVCLEGDVFDGNEIDLQRIQLLSVVVRKQRLLTLDCEVQVLERHWLELVEFPCHVELFVLEQQAGEIDFDSID